MIIHKGWSTLSLCLIGIVLCGCSLFVEPPREIDTDISDENLDAVISEGIEAWRTQGATMRGAACANCHAPDALDLAYFDFDEQTIRRRAEPHVGNGKNILSQKDVTKIIKLVKAQRAKYNIKSRDPMKTRPLQPGGEVLPGATAAERDQAFAEYLKKQGYRFANIAVLSEKEALRQRDEWLKLSPRSIKIGIPLNRWSEDPHHGSEHATMADWLPDMPRIPKNGKADDWYALQDRYLKNPTDKNFWKMFAYQRGYTMPISDHNSNRFFNEKYQSVLLAQHIFRKKVMGQKPLEKRPTTAFMPIPGETNDNPVWDVASIAHVLRNGDLRGEEFQLSSSVKERSGNLVKEMNKIRVPWFYAGWLLDQGLQHSGEGGIVENGRYFTMHMHEDDSYPIHNIFMITRKMIVQNFDGETQDLSKPLSVNYSHFSDRNFAIDYAPESAKAKKMYKLITENSYRMMLLLMKKEIQENGIPTGNSKILSNWFETIKDFKDFAEYARTENYEYNLQLIADVRALLQPLSTN